MSESPSTRLDSFQYNLRDATIATFWLSIAVASATVWRPQPWSGFVLILTVIAAVYALRGRYRPVLVTIVSAALFFLLTFLFRLSVFR